MAPITLIIEPSRDLIIGGHESPDFRIGKRHIPMICRLDFALPQPGAGDPAGAAAVAVKALDPRGIEAVVTKVPSWKWMERVSRKICVEMGSIASTCKAPRTGAEVKEWAIHFTTTKAIGIGQRVREARRRHEDPVAATLDEGHGKLLFRGKVVRFANPVRSRALREMTADGALRACRNQRHDLLGEFGEGARPKCACKPCLGAGPCAR